MTPEQKAALAVAGYTRDQIEEMTAAPVTVETLAEEVQRLRGMLEVEQKKAIDKAEQPKTQSIDDILKSAVQMPEVTK